MKIFTLTAPSFKGSFEIWYGFDGMLARIDLLNCTLNYEQVQYIIRNISPDISQFKGMLTASNLVISEKQLDPTVDDFLHQYPYQRNTHLARSTWPKMPLKDRILALFRAMDYAAYCKANAHWYKPQLPDTWLKKKQYLNDWKNA